MRTLLAALVVAAIAVGTAVTVASVRLYDGGSSALQPIEVAQTVLWAAFALAIVLLRRVPRRAVVALVLAGSAAIGVASLAGPPATSTDSARYAWDGIVQNAGISPYRYTPTDPALTALRPTWLFRAPHTDASYSFAFCTGEGIMLAHEPDSDVPVCSAINRADSPTIYPPVAEVLFAAERAIVGPDAQYWPMQLAGLLASLAVTVLLLRELVRRGRDPRWAALWGWCPLVASEAVNNAHVDVVATLLLVVATIAVSRGRRIAGGVALGAAIATKLIPAIGAPALLGRKPWGLAAAAIGTFVIVYLPYVAADGLGVLGYLPSYLSEEGYDSGSRFALLSLIAPGVGATAVAAVVILGTAIAVWWRTRQSDPWLGQLVMIGVTLLAVTPSNPWYALLLVPMIAMTGRWEWLAIPLALAGYYLYRDLGWGRLAFALAGILIVAVSVRRAGPSRVLAGTRGVAARVFGARANTD